MRLVNPPSWGLKLSLAASAILAAGCESSPLRAIEISRPASSSGPAPSSEQTTMAPPTAAPNASASLTRYQLALDQLAAGRLAEARVILEAEARRAPSPEVNLLLAYILEREGKMSQARAALDRVSAQSPLATAYRVRLNGLSDGAPASNSTATAPASASGSTPNAARSPLADARLGRLEKLMLQLVNAERARFDLPALTWSDDLSEIARAHSVEMRERKYFAHESPTPSLRRPMDRYVAATGITPRLVAENIYRAWGTQHQLGDSDLRAGHDALMKSPGHRANILHANVARLGVGIAVNQTGDIWITQVFDRP
jgi:uncharacterized protein YkwD